MQVLDRGNWSVAMIPEGHVHKHEDNVSVCMCVCVCMYITECWFKIQENPFGDC
jgi:hypothetical protein